MANVTRFKVQREQVLSRLQMYYEAEKAILEGAQSYTIGSRSLSRADLGKLQDEIKRLETKLDELDNALVSGSMRNKTVRVIPRDL